MSFNQLTLAFFELHIIRKNLSCVLITCLDSKPLQLIVRNNIFETI